MKKMGLFCVLMLSGCGVPDLVADPTTVFTAHSSRDYRDVADCIYAASVSAGAGSLTKVDLPSKTISRIERRADQMNLWTIQITKPAGGQTLVEVIGPPSIRDQNGILGLNKQRVYDPIRSCLE